MECPVIHKVTDSSPFGMRVISEIALLILPVLILIQLENGQAPPMQCPVPHNSQESGQGRAFEEVADEFSGTI